MTGIRDATTEPNTANKNFKRLLTCDLYPIRYLPIQKCGCTFVKNILWNLQFGCPHKNPARVHDDEGKLPYIEMRPENAAKISREEMAFTVIRKPADRFVSLYFDKIVGGGRFRFPPLASLLENKKGLNSYARSPEEHRMNCEVLLDWIEENISSGTDIERNPHWMPFSRKAKISVKFKLKVLLTTNLSHQLTNVLSPEVLALTPSLSRIETNASVQPVPASDVLSRDLKRKIKAIYYDDHDAYEKTRDHWKRTKEPPRANEIWK